MAVLLFVVAWTAAIGAGIYKLSAMLTFEQTDRAIFKEWVLAEFGRAAQIGCLLTAVATVIFALLQRRHSPFAIGAPIAAVLVVASLIVAAAFSRAHRSHPVPEERAIAQSVPLPATWGPGTLYVLPQPASLLTADSPRVDRVIDTPLAYTPVCNQLLASLSGWKDAHLRPWGGGSNALGPLTPKLSAGIGCTMLGTTPQGWQVTLSAWVHPTNPRLNPTGLGNAPSGMTRVIIEVTTPTN